jgi:hypothetical protein
MYFSLLTGIIFHMLANDFKVYCSYNRHIMINVYQIYEVSIISLFLVQLHLRSFNLLVFFNHKKFYYPSQFLLFRGINQQQI